MTAAVQFLSYFYADCLFANHLHVDGHVVLLKHVVILLLELVVVCHLVGICHLIGKVVWVLGQAGQASKELDPMKAVMSVLLCILLDFSGGRASTTACILGKVSLYKTPN